MMDNNVANLYAKCNYDRMRICEMKKFYGIENLITTRTPTPTTRTRTTSVATGDPFPVKKPKCVTTTILKREIMSEVHLRDRI